MRQLERKRGRAKGGTERTEIRRRKERESREGGRERERDRLAAATGKERENNDGVGRIEGGFGLKKEKTTEKGWRGKELGF